ncbi:MAG: type II toxin-antitoxin system VapC family toxin [Chloroflexi bacterium]|nr:type II toxin-antitoxin system VapC family toxin [Chloroflexota bacterium]
MTDYYADSSVLVKRHVREAGTDWFRAQADLASGQVITTARISEVEVYSAFNRRVRETVLTPAQYIEIAGDFALFCLNGYQFVEFTPALSRASRQLLERYPLRAYDAVQLASALSARAALVADGLAAPVFLSSDERLLDAARSEGLLADNPNLHP